MLTETLSRSTTHQLRILLILLLFPLLPGCYVMQAATGEWRVMRARKPIETVVADPRTSDSVRTRLTEVRAARDFAVRELHLPDNRSYRTYADVRRPYVVWNVVATPEFSVSPKRWCFPVAGCVAYRGYFAEKNAKKFAAGLAKRGFDVALDGVPAYSTLGKFADPVLSTMLRYGDDDLVAMIFHELAHQLLYVPNDSEFNEAFAVTVEDAGLERWLESRGEAGHMERVRQEQTQERAFVDLFTRYRARLIKLYASGLQPQVMRQQKAAAFAELATDIQALEQTEGLRSTLYDKWIAEGLNNARLASLATYFDCVPGFERLLAQSGGDLPRFYVAARELARQPRATRHAQLCSAPAQVTTEVSR